jgi:uncharacterized spore protein YtfJ
MAGAGHTQPGRACDVDEMVVVTIGADTVMGAGAGGNETGARGAWTSAGGNGTGVGAGARTTGVGVGAGAVKTGAGGRGAE